MEESNKDNLSIDQRIERFLRGQMQAEEETRFKEDLKNDPELRERAQALSFLIRCSRQVAVERDEEVLNSAVSITDRDLVDAIAHYDQEAEDANIRIEKFLRGQMSEEEESTFKQELNENEGLRTQAQAMTALVRGCNAIAEERDNNIVKTIEGYSKDEFINKLEQFGVAASVSTQKKDYRIRRYILSIAAVFIGLLIIPKVYLIVEYRSLISAGGQETLSYFESSSRGAQADSERLIVEDLNRLFKEVLDGKQNITSITDLEKLYAISTDDYADDIDQYSPSIGYFLAVAYANDGQKDKAKKVLQVLLEENPDNQLAKKLFNHLNKKWIW